MPLIVKTQTESSLGAATSIARVALGAVILVAGAPLVTLRRPAPEMDS